MSCGAAELCMLPAVAAVPDESLQAIPEIRRGRKERGWSAAATSSVGQMKMAILTERVLWLGQGGGYECAL